MMAQMVIKYVFWMIMEQNICLKTPPLKNKNTKNKYYTNGCILNI